MRSLNITFQMKEKEAVHLSWRTQKCYICNYFGGSNFRAANFILHVKF